MRHALLRANKDMSDNLLGYCTLCRSRCGSINQIENNRLIKVLPDASHPTGGALCAKGRAAPEQLHSPLRLQTPKKRVNPRDGAAAEWRDITWDEALDEIAARLGQVRDRHGAEAVAFAVTTPSGTPMVDSVDWVERFIRCFGSPNLIYAVEVCGWHKDYAHALTFGRGLGVPDLDNTDTVVLWGHNPARTWLAQASRIASARQRGAKLVVVDPKIDGSGEQADLWIRIRPGADGALALGAVRHLIASDRFDHDFVAHWTNAPLLVDRDTGALLRADEFWDDANSTDVVVIGAHGLAARRGRIGMPEESARLREAGALTDRHGRVRHYASVFTLLEEHVAPYTVEHVSALTWVDAQQVSAFNALFENHPRLCYYAWTGLGQHTNATQTERAVATLYALTGACEKEGGNIWTVAPPYRQVNDYQTLLPASQREKALGLQALPLGPPRYGWITARDFAQAALHGDPYPVRALMSFGTNLLASQSDGIRNADALRSLDFHVHVDMFMNPTAENADIVLPASMPWEREALKFGFEITQAAVEHVQLRQRMVTPLGECKADYEIAFALAARLGMNDAFFGGSIEAGWNHQLEPLGITVGDLRAEPAGRRFPQPFDLRKYARMGRDGKAAGFQTPSGLVELYSETLLGIGEPALPSFVEPVQSPANRALAAEFPIVLTTAKSGWFVHTSHRYIASLRRKSPAPTVQISAALAARERIQNGDWAAVFTPAGKVRLQAKVDDRLHDGVAIAEFGWWQGCEPLGLADINPTSETAATAASAASMPTMSDAVSSNINSILSDADRDPVSGSVPLRATLCRIASEPVLNRGRWQGQREFVLVSRTMEADDVVALDFAPTDGRDLPDFLPGQHVVLAQAGSDVHRAYSLTGPNRFPKQLSIGVRLARGKDRPDGVMSTRVHALAVGDRVLLTPPAGIFTIPTTTQRPLVFMASGIGITPFIAHLEALALALAFATSPSAAPEVLLINLCRNGDSHPFKQRLASLAQRLPSVHVITVYWDANATDRVGIDYDHAAGPNFDWIDRGLIDRRALAYLCGSPTFLEQARAGLIDRGIPNFDIFAETFSAETAVPSTLTPQLISVEGDETPFEWRPERGTLLDAADEAGVSLPSGCRVGQCESCEMQIVSGEVVHLSPYDGPPDRCLTCRAVPITAVVLRR